MTTTAAGGMSPALNDLDCSEVYLSRTYEDRYGNRKRYLNVAQSTGLPRAPTFHMTGDMFAAHGATSSSSKDESGKTTYVLEAGKKADVGMIVSPDTNPEMFLKMSKGGGLERIVHHIAELLAKDKFFPGSNVTEIVNKFTSPAQANKDTGDAPYTVYFKIEPTTDTVVREVTRWNAPVNGHPTRPVFKFANSAAFTKGAYIPECEVRIPCIQAKGTAWKLVLEFSDVIVDPRGKPQSTSALAPHGLLQSQTANDADDNAAAEASLSEGDHEIDDGSGSLVASRKRVCCNDKSDDMGDGAVVRMARDFTQNTGQICGREPWMPSSSEDVCWSLNVNDVVAGNNARDTAHAVAAHALNGTADALEGAAPAYVAMPRLCRSYTITDAASRSHSQRGDIAHFD